MIYTNIKQKQAKYNKVFNYYNMIVIEYFMSFYLCLKVVLSNECFKPYKTNYTNNLDIKRQRQFCVKNIKST